VFGFAESVEKLPDYAWIDKNGLCYLQPVAKLKPNPWDLYDVLGNAGEYTGDTYWVTKLWASGKATTDPAMPPTTQTATIANRPVHVGGPAKSD
jgi:formylglycine-generating enzyme required for sulfatase activity